MKKYEDPKLLIVDDNPINLKVLAQIADELNYEVIMAMSGIEALNYLKNDKPDLILLDVMMPELDGYETCKEIKKNEELKHIPIIFITAKTDTEDVVKGFNAGAVDYVSKPFNRIELIARINTHIELKKSRDQLHELIKELEVASMTDSLTGAYNRRHIIEKLKYMEKVIQRNDKHLSISICDLDDFKKVNDTLGHDFGDFILKSICDLITKNLRGQDIFGRWGGEEFILVLPETDLKGAHFVCENIRKKIAETTFTFNNQSINITMTFGVAQINIGVSIEEAIKSADLALYSGKNSGKNCVC